MIKAAPGSERLKSFVERYEKLAEERKAIGGDMSDVLSEAKGVGYDPKTIRWAIAERAMDMADRAERDALRDTYAVSLGLAIDAVSNGDVSLRQAAKTFGVSKSSIHRGLAVPDCPSVEMTIDDIGIPDAEPMREMTLDDLGDPLLVIDKPRGQFRDKIKTIAAGIKPSAPVEAAPVDERTFDEIVGDLPAHLRRERASA